MGAHSLTLPCGSRDRTRVVRLSCKHLGALGHLAGHISISKVTPGQFALLTHAFVYLYVCVCDMVCVCDVVCVHGVVHDIVCGMLCVCVHM